MFRDNELMNSEPLSRRQPDRLVCPNLCRICNLDLDLILVQGVLQYWHEKYPEIFFPGVKTLVYTAGIFPAKPNIEYWLAIARKNPWIVI